MAETIAGEKKSSKKIWIIIALLVLLGGGGGAGYFFFMKGGKEAETGKQGEKAEHAEAQPEEEPKHEEEVESHEHEVDVYYPLPAPLIVNFPAGSSAKLIKISLTVLVKGEANTEALKKHEPMIRNNLLMAIGSVGADKAKTLEGKQELKSLMVSEIGKVLERMTKKNSVKDVFFTEFVMQ